MLSLRLLAVSLIVGLPILVHGQEFPPQTFDRSLDRGFVLPVNGDLSASDHFCLKMRSYVVARDSKDSDSVHLTDYSTCQPASRYRVKTTQAEPAVITPSEQQIEQQKSEK